MSARRILLIEDDTSEAVLATRTLHKILPDAQVEVVENGLQALDFLSSEDFPADIAFALMDLHMPGMGGLEFLQRVQDADMARPFPLIVFSSSEDPDEIARAYQLGASAFVTKPVEPARYRLAMEHIVNFWLATNRLS